MKRKHFAHSLDGKVPDEWHSLDEHLTDTAKLARSFANVFRAGEWAYLAGLWHVLGRIRKGYHYEKTICSHS